MSLKCNVYIPDTGITIRASNLFGNVVACDPYAFVDKIGHGTMVASIYAQMVPEAILHIYNHSPGGKHNERLVFDALADIEKRVKAKPSEFHLINTSFMDSQPPESELGQEINYWGRELVVELGAMWVTAASNEGRDIADIIIPAGFEWATVAGGLDRNGRKLWKFSNTGNVLDFVGPAEHVFVRTLNGWSYRDGTSLSTPYVGAQACAVAMFLAENGLCAAPKDMDVYRAMKMIAVDMGEAGRDKAFGHGCVNLDWLPELLNEWPKEPAQPEQPDEPDEPKPPTAGSAQAFYNKVRECVGNLYVWGGQGHNATEAWLRSKAKMYPQYFDGGRLEMMLARIKEKPALRAWDCSGLVCWALAQIGVGVDTEFDTTANGLFANYCTEIKAGDLQTGDLLFRYSGGKMVHVGIYAPGACVEAAGGAYGVVVCNGLSGADHRAISYVDGNVHQLPNWTHYGRLKVLAADVPTPTPEPAPTGAPTVVTCTGASVNVRSGPSTSYGVVIVAHAGDKFIALPAQGGWRRIAGFAGNEPVIGYMSDKYLKEV